MTYTTTLVFDKPTIVHIKWSWWTHPLRVTFGFIWAHLGLMERHPKEIGYGVPGWVDDFTKKHGVRIVSVRLA